MSCKLRPALLVALAFAAVTPLVCGQCKKGGGGGGGGHGGGYPGGGYPPIVNPQPYPPYGGGYPDPYGGAYPVGVPTYPSSNTYPNVNGGPLVRTPTVQTGTSVSESKEKQESKVAPEDETSLDSLDAMLEETLEGVEWDVLVEHPIRGEFAKVKSFGKEKQARKFVDSLESRYWVVFAKEGESTKQFREVKTATDAKQEVARLAKQGYTVEKPIPVTAKLVMNDVASLLADQSESIEFPTDSPTSSSAQPDPKDSAGETVSSEAAIPEPAKSLLDAALVPLLGMWKAVARDPDGQLTTIELKLDANGWATLVMPAEDGGRTSVERRVVLEDGELKLNGEKSSVSLGKLANADANRLTLERPNGQVTFVRP